mmetsp:Transcript_17740/g.25122  ORF Transcript_17740/g.25122 Transcript_17740/m.25122 type:complete len:243 (-) Transcript_17740:990-1718(-)
MPPENFADDSLFGVAPFAGHDRNFPQHGQRQMAALQQVQIDVHVVGHLPPPLGLFLLGVLLLVTAGLYPLSQELLDSAGTHVFQTIVRLCNESLAKGAESHGHDHSIVQNLSFNVGHRNIILQVTHQQQVAGRVEPIVEGMVRDLAEHRPRLRPVRTMLVQKLAQIRNLVAVVNFHDVDRGRPKHRCRVDLRVPHAFDFRQFDSNRGRVQHIQRTEGRRESLAFVHSVGDGIMLVIQMFNLQ